MTGQSKPAWCDACMEPAAYCRCGFGERGDRIAALEADVARLMHEPRPSGWEYVVVGPDALSAGGSLLSGQVLCEWGAAGWRVVSVGFHAGSGAPRWAVLERPA